MTKKGLFKKGCFWVMGRREREVKYTAGTVNGEGEKAKKYDYMERILLSIGPI
jgi:hypothetical protein